MTNAMQEIRSACVAVALLAAGAVAAGELDTRTSSAGGVTVKVTPRDVAPGSATWAFAVVLETHTRDLSDDLVKTSVLLAQGARYAPLAWEGAPPGGHHREGLLRFEGLGPAPGAFELQIRRTGEAAPRSFRWTLK